MIQRENSGVGCDLASTLCKYDLRKADVFVRNWERVQRMRQGSISSELPICGGGERSILLLSLVARCLERTDVCIWRISVYVCCSDCVGGMCACFFYVAAVVKDSVFLSIGVLKYVVCLCKRCD